MTGTQQTQILILGLDCFRDPDRAKHSAGQLVTSIDLMFWISRKGWAIHRTQHNAKVWYISSNPCNYTFNFPDKVNVCYQANYIQYKCKDYRSDPNVMKPVITAIPAQDFSHDIFATFAIPVLLLTLLTTPDEENEHEAKEPLGTLNMFLTHCMIHYFASLTGSQITLHRVKHVEIETIVHDRMHSLLNVMWLKISPKISSQSYNYYQYFTQRPWK